MSNKKDREQIIKEFLGLEELSPMELGVIQGGTQDKKFDKKLQEKDIDTDY